MLPNLSIRATCSLVILVNLIGPEYEPFVEDCWENVPFNSVAFPSSALIVAHPQPLLSYLGGFPTAKPNRNLFSPVIIPHSQLQCTLAGVHLALPFFPHLR